MKIIVYTITECQFSKQEKEYLQGHNLPFEEKNLETNREFLTEMLAVSNNFAGTPVTKIEKDDGQIVVLKGFTKEEFDKTLGFAASAGASAKAENGKVSPEKPAEASAPPAAPAQPSSSPQQPAAPPVPAEPAPPQAPVSPEPQTPVAPAQPDPMASVLNNLAQQAQAPAAPATPPPPATPGMPNIPDPQL